MKLVIVEIRNGNKQLMRDINKSKILNLVRTEGPISRVGIAKKLKLSQATVTYITEELFENNFLIEEGEQKSTGGRKAKLLQFNDNIGVIAGVGISKGGIEIVLCDLRNQAIDHNFSDESFETGEDATTIIARLINALLMKQGHPQLLGISIISSGLVDRNSGTVVKSTLLNWHNVPIVSLLRRYYPDVRILLDKDINAVAMYEMNFGHAQSLQDFLVVSVGEGLGLSVVIRKHIYYGDYGGAGEFGHTVINVGGYKCHCGQHGCLEQYASEFYLRNKLRETNNTDFGTKHLLTKIGDGAENGDSVAIELLREMGTYLGYGIRNLINVFNPKAIVLVGEAIKYSNLFLERTLKTADNNFFSNADLPTKVLTSDSSNDAWYQGASILISNSLFETPIYQEVNNIGGLE